MAQPRQPKAKSPNVKVVNSPDEPPQKDRCKDCCKMTMKFLFSHIGLCGMVIAYSVAGGFIFQHLEKTNELQECVKSKERYDPLQNKTMFNLWDISTKFRAEDDQVYAMLEFAKQLEDFRNSVLTLGYDGTNCTAMDEDGPPGYQWSFPGALLFSVTVITTIGYGNIAPKTFWGRLVCMAYATLGIPLMLLCLANIGDVMADIFRFVYTKVCCCGCCRRKEKNKPDNGNSPEDWKNKYNNQRGMAEGQDPNQPPKNPIILDDDEDDEDEEEDKISVPLTITMGVIGGYIFMGALLFGVWEGWDPLKAAYFCFVTISTIGFGDVVPGSAEFENAEDQWKMIGAAVYMLFGMAILSMCFSLIQEEIVAKFRWVGEKIGILEKEKPAEVEEEEDPEAKDQSKDEPSNAQPQQAVTQPQKKPIQDVPPYGSNKVPPYASGKVPPSYGQDTAPLYSGPEKFKM